jgi:hypothetical protein
MERKSHSIHDRLPHVIFSVENPKHPLKFSMSHEDALKMLRNKGYNAEEMTGHYGNVPEKSILVHNPPKHTVKHLFNLAQALGQESAIISNGHSHELHYLNGEKTGKHHKGSGTLFYASTNPEDNYSQLSTGDKFSHNFDFDTLHKKSDFLKNDVKMKKSEDFINGNGFKLYKAEKTHILSNAGPETKLIHYSPEQGLKSIDPEHHGVRGIGSEVKQGVPSHKMSFHYLEGIKPESLVTSGAKSKYISSLGDKKLYDIGEDPMRLKDKAKERMMKLAQNREVNRGIVRPDDLRDAFHQEIKTHGYHGIFNSGLDDTMSHVVGMFVPMKPEAEHPIHPNDFKRTSLINHHDEEKSLNRAKDFAEKTGSHDYKFLHNLSSQFKK